GIGAWTAIAALVLYALLPIVRNTYAGIAGVDPAIREAGRGMGLSDGELLRLVELPLAAGVILAGVRVAVVVSVGVATIAAAIGGGGLGGGIFFCRPAGGGDPVPGGGAAPRAAPPWPARRLSPCRGAA